MAKVLDTHHLTAVGGFTPVLMHQAGNDPLPEIDRILAGYDATGATTLVLSAVSGLDGYDSRPELDADGWALLLRNLDRISARAAEHGVGAVLHPHVGTMVETGDDVQRVLEGSAMSLCLDTGPPADRWDRPGRAHSPGPRSIRPHALQGCGQHGGGQGPLRQPDLLRRGRAGHVPAAGNRGRRRCEHRQHLAVQRLPRLVHLEQDTILTEQPPAGAGPIENARISADYVRSLLAPS
jgi:inosose dehydratase